MSNWWSDTFFTKSFWIGRERDYGAARAGLGVTVVIPAYNEAACLAQTLTALQASTYPVDIIVVDDCSTDETGDIARSFAGVTVLRPEKNNGTKSRALNYALPFVTTEIFVCVDADTIVEPESIATMLPYFNDPKVGIVSGYVMTQKDHNVWESGRQGEYVYGQVVYKNAQNHINCILVASGCFSAMRTDLLRTSGGYKERSIAEDMDLTWEFIEQGYTVKFATKAICRVIDPSTRKMYYNQVSRWYRGYFQCIRIRNFDLFTKNPKLGLVAYFYIAMNLLGTPLLALAVFNILGIGYLHGALAFLGYYVFLVWIPLIWKSRKLKIGFGRIAKSIISMPVVYLYTMYIFFESMVKELILGDQLVIWHKGH